MLNCALLIFFPTFRFPPAWNPSLERRKLMILTGSKLQPTLCRKFALHWKQLNLNHTFHWKAKPFSTQIGLQSRIKLIFDQGGLQRVSTCHWETPLLTSQHESSEFLQLITIAFICHQRHHKNPCRSLPRYPRPVIYQNQSSQGRLGPSLLRLINSIRQLQKVKTHFSKRQKPKLT